MSKRARLSSFFHPIATQICHASTTTALTNFHPPPPKTYHLPLTSNSTYLILPQSIQIFKRELLKNFKFIHIPCIQRHARPDCVSETELKQNAYSICTNQIKIELPDAGTPKVGHRCPLFKKSKKKFVTEIRSKFIFIIIAVNTAQHIRYKNRHYLHRHMLHVQHNRQNQTTQGKCNKK